MSNVAEIKNFIEGSDMNISFVKHKFVQTSYKYQEIKTLPIPSRRVKYFPTKQTS